MKDPIVQAGDPVLHNKAKPVAKKDFGSRALKKLITKMKKALAKEPFGVALAAPQVGESLRLFIIAGKAFVSDEEEREFPEESVPARPGSSRREPARTLPEDRVFINPELTRLSKKIREMSEGCLSVRGKYGTVMRHEKAAVKAFDENGKPFTYQGSGLIGHIFQHEVDHLEGILYTDKAVKLEEDEDLQSARRKIKEKHGL